MLTDTINLKLEVLCNGVNFTDDFLKYYKEQTESIEKRWAYGTGDSVILNSSPRTPQEIILDGQIIAAANYNPTSTIFIDLENGTPVLKNQNNFVKITFPRR